LGTDDGTNCGGWVVDVVVIVVVVVVLEIFVDLEGEEFSHAACCVGYDVYVFIGGDWWDGDGEG